jgi:hypothetical protein
MGFTIGRFLMFSALAGGALCLGQTASLPDADEPELRPPSDCTLFGAERERAARETRTRFARSALTEQVSRMRPRQKEASVEGADGSAPAAGNLIDTYIFSALKSAGVAPAPRTTDAEFIRRVTLDLTGRVPKPERVMAFTADSGPDKRAQLVDELMAAPEFVDKWTMYFGDHLKNTTQKTGVRVYDGGRDAFFKWIKDAVANNRPWDDVTRELISARGTDSYDPKQGAINWLVGGRVANGPIQDIWDQQVSNIAETFLGIAHVNCLECHDGRRHLDALSLWGRGATRYQAWQLSSFLSHSNTTQTPVDATAPNGIRYWSIADDVRPANVNYPLNTTTGNRPARLPVGSERNVAPVYFFTGEAPKGGENLRDALARMVTADFQFSRASVNYLWAALFGRGIVDPPNQFDPARLDADNPPGDGWALQPSNPQLLKALAQFFIDSGYDNRALIRLIVTSNTYQLSSRYEGDWNPAWEPLFARKLVRRLWGEEVMDALSQTSGLLPSFTVAGYDKFNWAMQAPEPLTISRGNNLLTAFMPGNRDDQERKTDGAVQQAMSMMNDNLVMSRTRAASGSLLAKAVAGSNDQLVNTLYLTVLSRYPTDAEKSAAITALNSGNRGQKAEDLLWSLYNKVDFLFNY